MCQNPFCFNHHRNVEKTTQARLRLAEIVDGKQFLNAVANISIWKETPKYNPCDSKLFCAKERLDTKNYLHINNFLNFINYIVQ